MWCCCWKNQLDVRGPSWKTDFCFRRHAMHVCEHLIDLQGLWRGWVTASIIFQPSPPQLRSPWQAAKPSSTTGSLATLSSLEGRMQVHSEALCLPRTPQLRGAWRVGCGACLTWVPLDEVLQRDLSYHILFGLFSCSQHQKPSETHTHTFNKHPTRVVCVCGSMCTPCKRHTSPAKHQTRSHNNKNVQTKQTKHTKSQNV